MATLNPEAVRDNQIVALEYEISSEEEESDSPSPKKSQILLKKPTKVAFEEARFFKVRENMKKF